MNSFKKGYTWDSIEVSFLIHTLRFRIFFVLKNIWGRKECLCKG